MSNADIEAVAETDGADNVEVGMDLFQLGVPKTTREPDTPSDEERARHNSTHIPANTWCEVCVFHHVVEMQFTVRQIPRGTP